MKLVIGEIERKPPFGARVQRVAISRPMPIVRWLVLTLIFSLLWFREFSSSDGPRSPLYFEAWGGFRWVDFLVLGLIYVHLLWILGARAHIPQIPSVLRKPAVLSLAALGISILWGIYQGGGHVYFDWRNIFLGVGLALVFSCRIRTPSALQEAVHIFALVTGLLVLYILGGYATGARSVLTVIPGLSTPLYDGPTLSAAVLLALFAFRFALHDGSSFRKTWWMLVGCAAFVLVLLSFRRTMWCELAIGILTLAVLQKKRRVAAWGAIGFIVALVVSLGGQSVFHRAESMDPFASGQSEYTQTNEDHVNDILDALDQVKQHPLLGIGLGNTYRTPRLSDWKAESWGVHNGLLHTWLLYGLLGLVAYLWIHVSLFRWLNRLQVAHSNPHAGAFAQVGLAFLVGPFLVSFAFSPWPYGTLNIDILVFFIIGSLLFLQAGSPGLKRK